MLKIEDIFYAIRFYTLKSFNFENIKNYQCVGECSSFTNDSRNNIFHCLNFIDFGEGLVYGGTISFLSNNFLYLIILKNVNFNNEVVDNTILLDENNDIFFDFIEFFQGDYGVAHAIDLDICTRDYIKSTKEYSYLKKYIEDK